MTNLLMPGPQPITLERVRLRPTLKLAGLFAISVPLAAIFLVTSGSYWPTSFFFPALCLILLVADLSMTAPPKTLQLNLLCPDRIFLGALSEISLTVVGRISYRPTVIEVAAEIEGPAAGQPPRGQGTFTGAMLKLKLPLTPARRGTIIFKRLWLRYCGPLGLCRVCGWLNTDRSIDSLQNISGLHQSALMFFRHEANIGQKDQPFFGEGSEFDCLVDYAAGMDNRFIDWKHSARHHKMLAKEFRQEKNHQIILGFDTGRLMSEPVEGLPKLDHFVRAGLLLAWVSLASGDMVGAGGFDLSFRAFLKPNRGRRFFSRIQHFTSSLQYRTEETNFTAGLADLSGRLPRRSMIVVFTEFIDTITASFLVESLGLLARKHIVVFVTMPDPLLLRLTTQKPGSLYNLAQSVIADGFYRERAIVLEQAARLGVMCVDVPPKAMGTAILNRYLTIKQRGLL
ncbi:MAG: DUF58 domain-containing protein [Deltaproteobacteria bacterium]|jgi:uncharacterized protein (DUF58 family)|nr:DUF58 domain-containing protein [Deltaproteobacteria bacterium]